MLFKLSMKNQRRSIQDYSIYFFTLILGVSIFYIFNAMDAQTAMMEVSKTKSERIDTMATILSVMSVVVSFILGFLIVYASRFFIRKRKKEFGVYMTLGMHKSDISKILFLETLMIGFISLGVGLIIGIGLSQFMSLFVANMFKANMDKFVFVISKNAIVKTILYFLLMYIVVMIMNIIVIGKSQLIDLLSAHQKREKLKLKNPIVCLIIFAVACVMLAYAYYNVTAGRDNLTTEAYVLEQIVFGIVGTFFIFWSISGLVLMMLKKVPSIYNKKLNSFVICEVGNQINTTVIAGGIICLLLFSTICILSSCFTAKSYKEKYVEKLAPISMSLSKNVEDSYSIQDIFEKQNIDTGSFREIVDIYTYKTDTVTNKTLLGTYAKEVNFGEEFDNEKVDIIKLSDYNKAARLYGNEQLSLDEDEYIIVADLEGSVGIYNNGLKEKNAISIHEFTLYPKYDECKEGFLMMSYHKNNTGVIVVPDNLPLRESELFNNYRLINYNNEKNEDKEFKEYMDGREFYQKLNPKSEAWNEIYAATQSNIYDDSIGASGTLVFVGLYLGIVFMISGAAILALKEMSDAIDSRNKYVILRKIGTNEKEINRALLKQMAVFFGFPLILAVIHSIFGIQVCNSILSIYDSSSILPSLIITAIMIVFIYGGYFIVSYLSCRRVIK